MEDKTARDFAMGAHLAAFLGYIFPFGNLLGPLIIYLWKRDESDFVADQALEALNFQLTVTIAAFIAFMLLVIFIGIILLPIIAIANIVFIILAALAARNGERYRYPFCLRLIS